MKSFSCKVIIPNVTPHGILPCKRETVPMTTSGKRMRTLLQCYLLHFTINQRNTSPWSANPIGTACEYLGYVRLGLRGVAWGSIGHVIFFSRQPIHSTQVIYDSYSRRQRNFMTHAQCPLPVYYSQNKPTGKSVHCYGEMCNCLVLEISNRGGICVASTPFGIGQVRYQNKMI